MVHDMSHRHDNPNQLLTLSVLTNRPKPSTLNPLVRGGGLGLGGGSCLLTAPQHHSTTAAAAAAAPAAAPAQAPAPKLPQTAQKACALLDLLNEELNTLWGLKRFDPSITDLTIKVGVRGRRAPVVAAALAVAAVVALVAVATVGC